MDRSDEFDRDSRDVERTGDVLGLSGAAVPKSPDDPSAERDPEAVAKRRERIRSGDEEGGAGRTPARTAGATSIDTEKDGTGTGPGGN